MVRLFKHYVPHTILFLGMIDFVLLLLAGEGGWLLRLWQLGGELDAASLQQRARAMAAEWFARPGIPDGDYMLEVFDGVSDHNRRGKRG